MTLFLPFSPSFSYPSLLQLVPIEAYVAQFNAIRKFPSLLSIEKENAILLSQNAIYGFSKLKNRKYFTDKRRVYVWFKVLLYVAYARK